MPVMKYSWAFFYTMFLIPAFGAGNSFLAPASFPGTFADLDFNQRMDVLAAGYQPWESEYKNGRCVKNCAYPGITIADDDRLVQQHTAAAVNQLRQRGYVQTPGGLMPTMVPTPNKPATGPAALPPAANVGTAPTISNVEAGGATECAQRNPQIPTTQDVPVGEPLMGRPRITTPYGERIHPITGDTQLHKAVDFAAPIGTPVFAPAAGTVSAAWTDASCGRGLRIRHADGFETTYCHLSDNSLVGIGSAVGAGCLVAKTGNTGRSTGAHLHYGIKKDGNFIDPTRFLNRS